MLNKWSFGVSPLLSISPIAALSRARLRQLSRFCPEGLSWPLISSIPVKWSSLNPGVQVSHLPRSFYKGGVSSIRPLWNVMPWAPAQQEFLGALLTPSHPIAVKPVCNGASRCVRRGCRLSKLAPVPQPHQSHQIVIPTYPFGVWEPHICFWSGVYAISRW